MRFRTTAGALAAGLVAAESGARGTGVVGIRVVDGVVGLSGADGEMGIDLALRAGGIEDGEVALPPRPVILYSQTLDPEVPLELSLEAGNIHVTGDGRVYKFTTTQARLARLEKPGEGVHKAAAGDLGTMLGVVRHAVDPRTNLVKLSAGGGKLRLYATDSYRVASIETAHEGTETWSALFPVSGLQLALKWQPEEMLIDTKGRVALFTGGGVETTIRLGAAEFPAVESVLERRGAIKWSVRRGEMVRAVQRLASVAGNEALRCEISDGELCVKVSSGDGSGVEYVSVDGEADGWFGISAKNLVDALGSVGGDRFELHYEDPKKPVYLCDQGTVLVVMPVVWSGASS